MREHFSAPIICCVALALSGCSDILPWPGFQSLIPATSYPEQIPASAVAEQVRCELFDFIDAEEKATKSGALPLLDPNGGAAIQLKLSTDLQGSVTWVGINLSKLGLGSLAQLVSKSNNIPSLQLKGQGKSTVTSQIDFVVPQSSKGPTDTLRLRKCAYAKFGEKFRYNWLYLYLNESLARYKARLTSPEGASRTFLQIVCQPKLTISTQFQLLFDVSAGTNAFNTAPILLPISGLTIDASPDYTHFLQIGFTLRQDNQLACKKIQPNIPPPPISR